MQSLRLKYAMIKLKPGFHMIATIVAIAEKKKKHRSYETTLQRSQRSQRQQ